MRIPFAAMHHSGPGPGRVKTRAPSERVEDPKIAHHEA